MVDDRWREWAPRLVAPLAFFVAATVLIILIHGALSSDDTAASRSTSPTATQPSATTQSAPTTATTEEPPRKRRPRRFYEIQSGDTLATIAVQYGTTVAELEALNPGIDPAALTVGERIRIR